MEKRLRLIFLSIVGIILVLSLLFRGLLDFPLVRSILFSIIFVLVIIIILFLQWAWRPMGKKHTQNLKIDNNLMLRKNRFYYELSSKNQTNDTGIIFYPGGRIVPAAYIPFFEDIALIGTTIFIVRMPFNMAVFDYLRAIKIVQKQQNISNWIIGGHSLGGAMAAHLLMKSPIHFKGLFLWGAYPSHRDDMSDLKLPILSIYGDCDGITTVEKIERSKDIFPDHTQWLKIEGGNHSQFGCYGEERQDQPSKLSAIEQRKITVDETLSFITKTVLV